VGRQGGFCLFYLSSVVFKNKTNKIKLFFSPPGQGCTVKEKEGHADELDNLSFVFLNIG
jgi:hypothetical protein